MDDLLELLMDPDVDEEDEDGGKDPKQQHDDYDVGTPEAALGQRSLDACPALSYFLVVESAVSTISGSIE